MAYGYMQDYSDELMRASGNNPWYNPYSKYPNIGGGIRSLVNQLSAIIQMKQAKEQQETETKAQAAKEAEEARRWRLEYLQKEEHARRAYELAAGKQEPKVQPQFDPALLDTLEKKLDLPKGSMKSLTPDILKQTIGEYAKAKLTPPKPEKPEKQPDRGEMIRNYAVETGQLESKYMKEVAAENQKYAQDLAILEQSGQKPKEAEPLRKKRKELLDQALAYIEARKQNDLKTIRKKYEKWLPRETSKLPPPPPGFVID